MLRGWAKRGKGRGIGDIRIDDARRWQISIFFCVNTLAALIGERSNCQMGSFLKCKRNYAIDGSCTKFCHLLWRLLAFVQELCRKMANYIAKRNLIICMYLGIHKFEIVNFNNRSLNKLCTVFKSYWSLKDHYNFRDIITRNKKTIVSGILIWLRAKVYSSSSINGTNFSPTNSK